MLKNALTSVQPASKQIFKDKINLLLAFVPVLIGVILYYFLGTWIYGTAMDQGQMLIKEYVSEGTMGTIVYYIVAAILTVMIYFLVNWTFVILVATIASPFNDMLSQRIEKNLQGKQPEGLNQTLKQMIGQFISTLLNELKKVSFIIVLSVLALLLGFFPLLTPISVFLSVLLLSVQFLDYNWSRHDLAFKSCINDVRKNIIGYTIGGAFFFVIVSVPVVNLIVPPLATSYFTILWIKNNEYINQAS